MTYKCLCLSMALILVEMNGISDECNNMLPQKLTEGESLRVTYSMNVGKKYSLSLMNSESH